MRAFYVECSAPFWRTVAQTLAREAGIVPVYWTGLMRYADDLRGDFPDLVYHDCIRAKYSLPELADDRLPRVGWTSEMESIWNEEAQAVYDMMSRFDFNKQFSFEERRRYFRRVLCYWTAVVDEFRPEILIFPNPPHTAYDYVLYAICRKRGVETVMFDEAAIYRRYKLNLTLRDIESGDEDLRSTYQTLLDQDDGSPVVLSPEVAQYLADLRRDYGVARPIGEKLVDVDSLERSTWRYQKAYARHLWNMFHRDWLEYRGRVPVDRTWLTSCYKQFDRLLEDSFTEPFSRIRFEHQQWYWRRRAKRRKAEYESLCRRPDAERPFVYVALAGQPERTSNPQGGCFTDQTLMVRQLSEAVPRDWQVLVKEHPNQFNEVFLGHMCRSQTFYRDLAAMPNVRLLPPHESPFQWMDRAQAVATIAGTTGWEAVVRGVPALTFGAAWYRDCEGVFSATTFFQCRDALERIRGGYRVDRHKVDLFVRAAELSCFEGLADPLPHWWTGLTDEENGERIARRILRVTANSASVVG
ncbi:MAG: hypothetical protein JNL96_22080 [Planctomycetaceae bacterium]|nr:hypothetical protein [Planctomycetaceae bacterium]